MRLTDGSPLYLVEAEELIVGGALLANPDDVRAVALSPRDFRDTSLGAIWTAIREGIAEDNDCSIPVVAWKLDGHGWLDSVGAEPRLTDLAGKALYMTAGVFLEAHASIIKDWSNRRAAIKQASQVAKAAYEGKKTTSLYDRSEYQNLDGLV